MLELPKLLHQQAFDWKSHFAKFGYTTKVDESQIDLSTHVVNDAMALKTSPVWWRISGDESDRDVIYQLLDLMDRCHGQASGVHSGDEHYAGLDPPARSLERRDRLALEGRSSGESSTNAAVARKPLVSLV